MLPDMWSLLEPVAVEVINSLGILDYNCPESSDFKSEVVKSVIIKRSNFFQKEISLKPSCCFLLVIIFKHEFVVPMPLRKTLDFQQTHECYSAGCINFEFGPKSNASHA